MNQVDTSRSMGMDLSAQQEETLRLLAQLAIPNLADHCIIDLIDASVPVGMAVRLIFTTSKQQMGKGPYLTHVPQMIRNVIWSRNPVVVSECEKNNDLRTLGGLDCGGVAVMLPLAAKRNPYGIVTLLNSRGTSRSHNEGDLRKMRSLVDLASNAFEREALDCLFQNALQEREDVLGVVSHELKNPISGLLLQVETLERLFGRVQASPKDAETITGLLGNSKRHIARLSHLVGSLWDYAGLASGSLRLCPSDFDFNELVREVVSVLSPEVEASGSEISFSSAGPIPGRWDRDRLEIAFYNLLRNAIKYGNGNPIHIHASSESGFAQVSFKDHGRGIAKEHHAKIFQRFERIMTEESEAGLGLGLFIVDQVVKAHGGSTTVESSLGHGAKFTLTIPLFCPERF